jgi:hypothetical protein
MRRTRRKITNADRARAATQRAERLERALKTERSKPVLKEEFPAVRQLQVWLERDRGFGGEVYALNIRIDPRSVGLAVLRNNRDVFTNISHHAAYISHDLARQVEKLTVEAVQKDGLVGGYR